MAFDNKNRHSLICIGTSMSETIEYKLMFRKKMGSWCLSTASHSDMNPNAYNEGVSDDKFYLIDFLSKKVSSYWSYSSFDTYKSNNSSKKLANLPSCIGVKEALKLKFSKYTK